MNGNSNGSRLSWLIGWVLGGLIGPLILAIANTTFTSANRIAVLEAQYRELKHTLDLIERKLDRVLERK